jgi:hypothetical protein
MARVILLALLGIPILVLIHAAGGLFSFDQAGKHQPSQTYWQSSPQPGPTYFVVEQTAKRGA